MKPAISVEGISKEYLLGSEQIGQQSFREMIVGSLTTPFRKFKRLSGQDEEQERFWALKDVSFEVEQGEIVGVIGRNGAGKSTLLKILSRITTPTEGTIRYRGRLASLLEVGTGFHPELTGRENIYLNGAILGMSKSQVSSQLDKIVEFSNLRTYLDTPVKRYSSGMYVRLAFSVAAHLDPDILIIDEVLAVGDIGFQQRCLGKMKDVADDGRTVIVVSHNMSTISSLCESGIFLDQGVAQEKCDVEAAIQLYTKSIREQRIGSMSSWPFNGIGTVKLNQIKVFGPNGMPDVAHVNGNLAIELELVVEERCDNVILAIGIYDALRNRVGLVDSAIHGKRFQLEAGINNVSCDLKSIPLCPGSYQINFSARKNEELLYGAEQLKDFEVILGQDHTYETVPAYGPVLFNFVWSQ